MLIAVINFSKKNKSEIIFSKGHAAMAYYVALKNLHYIKDFSYENYLKKGSNFWAHITKSNNNFLKFSFGSLGYGLGIAAGLAVGYKNMKKKKKNILYTLGWRIKRRVYLGVLNVYFSSSVK
jgi:transketolase